MFSARLVAARISASSGGLGCCCVGRSITVIRDNMCVCVICACYACLYIYIYFVCFIVRVFMLYLCAHVMYTYIYTHIYTHTLCVFVFEFVCMRASSHTGAVVKLSPSSW